MVKIRQKKIFFKKTKNWYFDVYETVCDIIALVKWTFYIFESFLIYINFKSHFNCFSIWASKILSKLTTFFVDTDSLAILAWFSCIIQKIWSELWKWVHAKTTEKSSISQKYIWFASTEKITIWFMIRYLHDAFNNVPKSPTEKHKAYEVTFTCSFLVIRYSILNQHQNHCAKLIKLVNYYEKLQQNKFKNIYWNDKITWCQKQ